MLGEIVPDALFHMDPINWAVWLGWTFSSIRPYLATSSREIGETGELISPGISGSLLIDVSVFASQLGGRHRKKNNEIILLTGPNTTRHPSFLVFSRPLQPFSP
jgi:hypothetical protein